MGKSRLPTGGTNLFQMIKAKSAEAEAKGIKLLKLSIGQPSGPALLSARRAAAVAIMNEKESMHEYQDNGSPGVPDFAKRFIQFHLPSLDHVAVDYLPIPGIKPILGLVPLACGCRQQAVKVATTTNPGYPTPRDWCGYLGVKIQELPLTVENAFRFSLDDIEGDVAVIMMNYPHNPSGQVATREWLEELCDLCVAKGIRIFNDAAYIALSHTEESVTLARVADKFPGLSWAEAYSASKLIGNGTGWRIGAIVGSPDFVADLKTVKGNTDSGFVAPMAAGVLAAIIEDKEGISRCREIYGHRMKILINLLSVQGMQLAVQPGAGFFTLWKTPKTAFGETVQDAQHFNFTMIERVGVVGVHFHPYIRYAVCSDIEAMLHDLNAAFQKAKVSY
ncbi:MAG: hypothetical protein COU98_01520 [Candidatus Staskawiczbacteria bacterium CG10_big_fil_rev_8_21_14_0_10_38_10]|uniref:Aminotransferase class I/classII large domain-containing protein n=1 Tax=Candidatus Staskawiczbacteria bacterium CG10_big_fil_rev_8_21_14_0_10_38_10 TaxID=1974891 RepID=A0A2H9T1B1_9BACT|nr:MAG: hypothetical protein COU98_01520 [Candidatus Staskawiczbacteria bacterium CG10_big_fil_rev_8_21_14_0_10_38_10]